jgi:5-methylcytosine-specific restriction enzyme subunit McrC
MPETLTEYISKEAVRLSREQVDSLRKLAPSISVTPSIGKPADCYDLTPSSWIGAVELPGLAIQIRPKIAIGRVLFLLSYAMDPKHWKQTGFFAEENDLVEAVIPGFVLQFNHAVERGILYGYRREESALMTVRGRIRLEDQIKKRFGIVPPVEVAYDEFTEDVEENRLLKAAFQRLGKLRIRSERTLNQVHRSQAVLGSVASVEYDPRRLPIISYTRLNDRYRPAVELAKLIIRSISYELHHGQVTGAAFLVDMNRVFQKFVTIALREALGLRETNFPAGDCVKNLYLDKSQDISLEPDISWWEGSTCVFVGDVKYKRINVAGIKHPDLYQLLAYVVATGLPGGLLIYAAGEGEPALHEVVNLGKKLEVVSLALEGPPEQVLAGIAKVAERVKQLRQLAKSEHPSQNFLAM